MKLFFSKALLLAIFLIAQSCGRLEKQEISKKPPAQLIEPYTKFKLNDLKAVVIKCDLGRMKLNIMQYDEPIIEIHKTYQKYVHLEPKGDTLYIYTHLTPRNTQELRIRKVINLYLPSLDYLESSVSRIIMKNFNDDQMKIFNDSNSLRLYNCRIRNLTIENEGLCNIQLDGNNYFEDLNVSLNEKSYYNSDAKVLHKFTLKAKSLEHTNFSNLPEEGFKWVKK